MKHPRNRDGLSSRCIDCRNAESRARYNAVPEIYAARHIRKTYGIDVDRFAAMVKAQNNACAICDTDMGTGKGRHIDHCHATGRIRALLCHHCNCALGHAGESPSRLRAMADYLEKHAITDA